MAVYRYIAGQNAHDRAVVSEVLLDSKIRVGRKYDGNSIWGQGGHGGVRGGVEGYLEIGSANAGTTHRERVAWRRGADYATASTVGEPGKNPFTTPIRWGGVFVKTKSGWRIASIFITPFESWRARRQLTCFPCLVSAAGRISMSHFDLRPPTEANCADHRGLDQDEQRVLLEHGTEAAFCGVFLDNHKDGIYTCRFCACRSSGRARSSIRGRVASFFEPYDGIPYPAYS